MSNLSYHSSCFGNDQNDTDYYHEQFYQHIQYQDTIQNQIRGPFYLPNESYYFSQSRRDQNDTNINYYQHLKQCLQHLHIHQDKSIVTFQMSYKELLKNYCFHNHDIEPNTKGDK